MKTGKASYELRASEVLNAVFDLNYQIPKPEEFRRTLQTKKMVAMPVEAAAEDDFVTEDMDAFMNYVRLNGIKTVMYTFRFYTEEDVDNLFKLSQADRSFFVKDPECDHLNEYQRYLSYVNAAIDLSCPNNVLLYALHNNAVIACNVDDPWLSRLPLPNAQTIRQTCVDSMSYSGSNNNLIRFRFIYDTADLTDQQEMLRAAPLPDNFSSEEQTIPQRSLPADMTDIPQSVSDITEESAETAESIVPETDDEPVETVEPIVPETDDEPAETVEPIVPKTEDAPAETVESIVPETEDAPAETVEPIVPETEDTPAKTVESIVPETEDEPAETVEPIVPETEDEPAETVEPIVPETEDEPVIPEIKTVSGSGTSTDYSAPDLTSAASELTKSSVPADQILIQDSKPGKKRGGLFKKKKRR